MTELVAPVPVRRPTIGAVVDALHDALVTVTRSAHARIDALWAYEDGVRPRVTVFAYGPSEVQRDALAALMTAVGVYRLPVPVLEGTYWRFDASSDESGLDLRVNLRQAAWPPAGGGE